MTAPHVSVIIPAYNEEDRIGKTLKRVHEHLSARAYSWEVVVVLDGSTDRTPEIVREHRSTFGERLSIEDYPRNRGKGYAVRTGMLAAQGTYRVFSDADNSTDIHYLDTMLKKFEDGYGVVISSRDKKDAPGAGQAVSQSWFKRQMGNLSNLAVQIMAVPGIWDTQNGFKGFTARAAEDIFSRATIDRWGFDFEVLAIARKLRYRIGIIPIIWKNDPRSSVKFSNYFATLKELLLVRWNLMTGKYQKHV
jgi:dolichyl-phosphate beta-glucosyltransferase